VASNRVEGTAHFLGNLLVALALEVKVDRQSEFLGQAVNLREDRRVKFPFFRLVVRVIARGRSGDLGKLFAMASLDRTDPDLESLQGDAGGDAEQPPTQRTAVIDGLGLPCQDYKALLERIFGVAVVSEDAAAFSQHSLAVPPDEQLECGFVTLVDKTGQ
jgi:hypothetical protein